jgi:hypothetical protein
MPGDHPTWRGNGWQGIRLSRVFPDGKTAVVLAMDHGQTFGPLPGLVDFTAAALRLKAADGALMIPQIIHT